MENKFDMGRLDQHEFDLGSKSKKVVQGPLPFAIDANGRNKKALVGAAGLYTLSPNKRYSITCTTDCYIAIGIDNTVVADNLDPLLLDNSVHIIDTSLHAQWAFMHILGTAVVVELD